MCRALHISNSRIIGPGVGFCIISNICVLMWGSYIRLWIMFINTACNKFSNFQFHILMVILGYFPICKFNISPLQCPHPIFQFSPSPSDEVLVNVKFDIIFDKYPSDQFLAFSNVVWHGNDMSPLYRGDFRFSGLGELPITKSRGSSP